MIHAKIMIVDGVWSSVGSTNMDSRSFGINDEINLAVFDNSISERLTQDFQQDISQSRRISLEQWNNRSIYERSLESIGWFLERQQQPGASFPPGDFSSALGRNRVASRRAGLGCTFEVL